MSYGDTYGQYSGGYSGGKSEVFNHVKIPLILSGAAAVIGWPLALACSSSIAITIGGVLAAIGTMFLIRFGVSALLSNNMRDFNQIADSVPMRIISCLVAVILINVLI